MALRFISRRNLCIWKHSNRTNIFRHFRFHTVEIERNFLDQAHFEKNGRSIWEQVPVERTRNFSIIAHIDHGKSTLSDALLETSGNISGAQRKGKPQLLDQLKVERDRGITVKAQSAAMLCKDTGDGLYYLLNLVDTPGHVDFSYEVTRSLSACEGALLLVDAAQGIQAQTLSNYSKAKNKGLKMIPVVTKIDLQNANVEETVLSIATAFDVDVEDVITTSAKTGEGISRIFSSIISIIPPPSGNIAGKLRCRLIDSWFDKHRGVICLIQVVDGFISEGDRISSFALSQLHDRKSEEFSAQEVGLLCPHPIRTGKLCTGQVGYLVAGMRSTSQALMGDTLFKTDQLVEPLSGFELPKCMLFASVYPIDNSDYENLCKAVDKLSLNDSSISISTETNIALGSGLRCGFLGLLHMEVFTQRLQDEFDTPILLTTPTVPYLIKFKNGTSQTINNISEWPVAGKGTDFTVYEPTVKASLIIPSQCLGAFLDLMQSKRGEKIDMKYLEQDKVSLTYILPWQEVVVDLHDQVKNLSAGYASFDYEDGEYQPADLVKVEIALNQENVDALAFICHRSNAESVGRVVCEKLKKTLDRQQFEIAIQARLGTKVFARETLKAYRKDVLTKSGKTVGGGDISRKKKLLEKQKQGKKRAKTVGKVQISQEAFWSIIQR